MRKTESLPSAYDVIDVRIESLPSHFTDMRTLRPRVQALSQRWS